MPPFHAILTLLYTWSDVQFFDQKDCGISALALTGPRWAYDECSNLENAHSPKLHTYILEQPRKGEKIGTPSRDQLFVLLQKLRFVRISSSWIRICSARHDQAPWRLGLDFLSFSPQWTQIPSQSTNNYHASYNNVEPESQSPRIWHSDLFQGQASTVARLSQSKFEEDDALWGRRRRTTKLFAVL